MGEVKDVVGLAGTILGALVGLATAVTGSTYIVGLYYLGLLSTYTVLTYLLISAFFNGLRRAAVWQARHHSKWLNWLNDSYTEEDINEDWPRFNGTYRLL